VGGDGGCKEFACWHFSKIKIMLSVSSFTNQLRLMVLVSFSFTIVILNRWIITELQEKSFGRVWQYYVSWGDFGFFRRGLLGTLLTETGLNSILINEYFFAYCFYTFTILVSYFIIYKILIKLQQVTTRNLLSFVVLFSPAMLAHFGYATGTNDLVLFLIFLCATIYKVRIIFFSSLLVCGILVHELFIFMLPAAVGFRYIFSDLPDATKIKEIFISVLACVIVIFLLFISGVPDISKIEFEAIMEKKIPNAAFQHGLWSGYFEIVSSVESNYQIGGFRVLVKNFFFIFIPVLYAASLAIFSAIHFRTSKKEKWILVIVLLFPILAQIVAGDFYRWVSMSACISLVFILLYELKCRSYIPKSLLLYLAVFSIFMPFGAAALDWPFPLHQFILKRFW
jgi:hypothetical protein